MKNVLDAILNIAAASSHSVEDVAAIGNRVTAVGDGLETYVKNAFANSFDIKDKNERLARYESIFSYQGNSSNPPDLMIREGDAFEIKKTESLSSELQLNSSFPKAKLFSSSSLINKRCMSSEEWEEKDFIYIVGHIPKKTKTLSSLWFIDGGVYAAEEDIYLNLKEDLTENLEMISGIDFSPTKELGRVNGVDPLRITNLRIRGMWLLKPPFKVFHHVHSYSNEKTFQCFGLFSNEKYFAFDEKSRRSLESHSRVEIKNVRVEDPNNPVRLVDCKMIYFSK